MNTLADTGGASTGAVLRNILRQAWPVLISQWAGIAFGVLDTAMTGHASPTDLAAMSLGVSIYLTVFVSLMGVIHALIPIIAQHYGAGRLHEAGRAWGQGVWLALGLSVAGGLLLCFPDVWLSFSGDVAPEVRERIRHYLQALLVALPAALVFRTVYAFGTAISRPKVVMAINLGGVCLKALCNWLLIYGKFGLPALGAVGAGISSAIVYWTSLAIALWLLRHDSHFRRFAPTLGRPQWESLRTLLRLGLPMGGSYLIEVCAFTFMALLIAREGTVVSGGHQILSNLAALTYMMPMAIGVAGASLVAQAIGAGNGLLARRTGGMAILVALAGAVLTVGLLAGLSGNIVRAYTSDTQVAAITLSLMPIIFAFHLADAMQCVHAYLLRAYKVAFVPMLIQALALAGLGLVGGWWLGFGPQAGTLTGWQQRFLPGTPVGAGAMWILAALGLLLAAVLMHGLYRNVVRRHVVAAPAAASTTA